MKTFLSLLIAAAGLNAFAAETYFDFVKGVDMTARSALSPTTLNQLVDNARLNTNRGIVLVQPTAPDNATYPRFTNFIWLDNSLAYFPVLKVWNGAVWTNSYSSSLLTETNLAASSVTTEKIANGAITTEKILNGAVSALKIAGSAVTSDKIADNNVLRSHLIDDLINTPKLTNGAVTGAKIADATITSEKITTVNAATITNLNGYVLSLNSNLAIDKLPQPSGNNSNYTLITGPNSLAWTTAPIADVVYMYPHQGTHWSSQPGGGYVQTVAHTLGRKPLLFNASFEFTNSFVGHQEGDEILVSSIAFSNSATSRLLPFSVTYNSTGVFLRCDATYWSNGTSARWVFPNGTNGGEYINPGIYFPTNLGRFKFYLR